MWTANLLGCNLVKLHQAQSFVSFFFMQALKPPVNPRVWSFQSRADQGPWTFRDSMSSDSSTFGKGFLFFFFLIYKKRMAYWQLLWNEKSGFQTARNPLVMTSSCCLKGNEAELLLALRCKLGGRYESCLMSQLLGHPHKKWLHWDTCTCAAFLCGDLRKSGKSTVRWWFL